MAMDDKKTPDGGQEAPQGRAALGKAKTPRPKKSGGFPKWAIWLIVVIVILVIAGIAVGVVLALGGGEEEAENQAPVITSLTADPDSLMPGEGSEITCVASDPDGDTLDYDWVYTRGELEGSGSTVTWIAPILAKTYTVRVIVSDGNGGTDEATVEIEVDIVSPTPTPTLIAIPTPTSTSTPVPSDGSIDIKSNPVGAKVYIDGSDTGSITPYIATHVPEGNHIVKLVYPLYKWRIGTVTVTGGETEYINWALDAATVQVLTLQPDATDGKDVYVYESNPTLNHETDTATYVSGNAAGARCRAYLQFNVSAIPSTAVILQANLGLFYFDAFPTATAGPVGAYGVTSSWDEAAITWNDQPSVASTALDTYTIAASPTASFLFWDIKALVRNWVDGSVTNYGVALMDTDESSYEGWKGLVTSDSGTASQRPKLGIQYYDPAP